MHTSPLDQAGVGDSGGLNVYVRELATAVANRGIDCDVYVRRTNPDHPDNVGWRKVYNSACWLAEHFEGYPLMLLAFAQHDPSGGSIYPAMWNAMLA